VGNDERTAGGAGDGGDAARLLQEHAADLFRHVRFLTGGSSFAEDIVQETMVRALTSFIRYDPQRPLRAWLHGIALKVTHKYWRRIRRARAFEQRADVRPEPSSGGHSPEEELLLRERANVLYRALDTLSPALREALLLHVGEKLSAEEVAQATGTTATNVYTRVCRARAQVRAFLEAEQVRTSRGEDQR
jgi:RNA polymerase sigma-70 factor (ECF subfamily)